MLELEWTTISYRAIALYATLALVLTGIVLYLIAPNFVGKGVKRLVGALAGAPASETDSGTTKREPHFVNIDGNVRVKRAGSLQWVPAGYNTSLEKGDFIQTGSDGVARIIFADGTNYTLKPDSLIVVEENREDPVTRVTKVSVQVSSGAVDLSTGKFEVPGSTSQVAFADARATLAEESRALVRNDPTKNKHELTVEEGAAEVHRGSAAVRLGQYEQVSFDANTPVINKTKVISPPSLVDPVNMALTMSKDPKSEPINFAWSEVPGAVGYHLQVSPSSMFSNFVLDKKIGGRTSAQVKGLDEGTYYWVVSSVDAKGIESQPSPANRFNLVQQVDAGAVAFLKVERIVQHGSVAEVVGRTEPGSTVIINNEQVFSIAPDGTFRHFTSPLKAGSNMITVTAQNRKGDTKTIREPVVIE